MKIIENIKAISYPNKIINLCLIVILNIPIKLRPIHLYHSFKKGKMDNFWLKIRAPKALCPTKKYKIYRKTYHKREIVCKQCIKLKCNYKSIYPDINPEEMCKIQIKSLVSRHLKIVRITLGSLIS